MSKGIHHAMPLRTTDYLITDYSITVYLFLNNLLMQPRLLSQQLFFLLNVVRIRHTTINWTYSRALRFFMKTSTLGTLSGNNIIEFVRDRSLRSLSINGSSVL